jgi:hypothetical protein
MCSRILQEADSDPFRSVLFKDLHMAIAGSEASTTIAS